MKTRNTTMLAAALLILWVWIGAGWSAERADTANTPMTSSSDFADLEKQWGVRPLTIRLTGADHFLDFRYLVTDSEKAKPVLSRNNQAYLMDQASGRVFNVPVTKIGPLRGTNRYPKAGKQYFVIFSNNGKQIHRGSKVSVIVGDFRAENMTVE